MSEWLERNRGNLALVLVVLVAVATSVLVQLPRRAALQVVSPSNATGPALIKVHVVGSVQVPGVYELPADARIEDALRAAGGPSPSADLTGLNLALPLRDGQQVAIPQQPSDFAARVEPTRPPAAPSPASATAASASSGKLDLNGASFQELDILPGIGPVTAQRILDYRTKNGRFVAVEELKEAKLVNNPTYERIRGMVEVK